MYSQSLQRAVGAFSEAETSLLQEAFAVAKRKLADTHDVNGEIERKLANLLVLTYSMRSPQSRPPVSAELLADETIRQLVTLNSAKANQLRRSRLAPQP